MQCVCVPVVSTSAVSRTRLTPAVSLLLLLLLLLLLIMMRLLLLLLLPYAVQVERLEDELRLARQALTAANEQNVSTKRTCTADARWQLVYRSRMVIHPARSACHSIGSLEGSPQSEAGYSLASSCI